MANPQGRWKPGQSGNPAGRRPNAEPRPWRMALDEALNKRGLTLVDLADKCITLGLAGNAMALREIADRYDGKPMQQIALSESPFVVDDDRETALERLREIAERLGLDLVPKPPPPEPPAATLSTGTHKS